MSFLGIPIERDDVMLLYNPRIGRYVSCSKAGFHNPGEHLIKRLRSMGLWGAFLNLDALYPHRSRRVLFFPESHSLWYPIPSIRTAGGYAYRTRRLTSAQVSLWRAFDGQQTLGELSENEKVPLDEAKAFCAFLTRLDVQALQFHTRSLPRQHPSLLQMLSDDRPAFGREEHMYDEQGGTDLRSFHANIERGEFHFDNVETSLAHCFAIPHPALSHETYGTRLYRSLEKEIPRSGLLIEIGAGTGELAQAWRSQNRSHRYVRIDASPELLAVQNRLLPETEGILADALALPFEDASTAVVLCNEVIADLEAIPRGKALRWIEDYDLSPLPEGSLYNVGAWKLLEEIERVLISGGVAYLSEFGDIDEIPTETEQLNHPEVSIHFGQLYQVATRLGLRARLIPVTQLLEFDMRSHWLSRHSYDALRARMNGEGRHLQARAWTRKTLQLPWPVDGLDWVSVSEPGPGPLPQRFWALILQK
ncbi:MAG: class I SAM-dependent methyltransferase [Myxococcota bacterium]|nr:class I SAM-dependent methyltransferase [Myxococcota bacterium]